MTEGPQTVSVGARRAPRFGLFVPQGWRLDLVGIPAASQWQAMLDVARRIDGSAFESLWVYDHFHTTPQATHEATHEAWTLMAAFAASTTSVRLGQMCTCIGYRNPAYLAKQAATVDAISSGRAEFGVGAGWYEAEWRAYGYDFPSVGDRIGALRDGVQLIQRLWADGEATLQSEHFHVDHAQLRPQPLQVDSAGTPRIPTWIAGGGERRTLKYAARWADYSNFGGNPEQFARKRSILEQHCESIGRDPGAITSSTNLAIVVRDTEAEALRVVEEVQERANAALPASAAGTGFATAGAVIGTPEQVAERLRAMRAAGADYLIAYMPEIAFDQTGIDIYEHDVMPLVAAD